MNRELIRIDNTDVEGRLVLHGKPILAQRSYQHTHYRRADAMYHGSIKFNLKTCRCRDTHWSSRTSDVQNSLKNAHSSSLEYDVNHDDHLPCGASVDLSLALGFDELHTTGLSQHYHFWRMPLGEDYDPQKRGPRQRTSFLPLFSGDPCARRASGRYMFISKSLVQGVEPTIRRAGRFVSSLGNCAVSVYP